MTANELLSIKPTQGLGLCILGVTISEISNVSEPGESQSLYDESKKILQKCLSYESYQDLASHILLTMNANRSKFSQIKEQLVLVETLQFATIRNYPYSRLIAVENFPPDIDVTCREQYLSEEEFQVLCNSFRLL